MPELSFARFLQIAIYALLNLMPVTALAIYAFRGSLRFSVRTTHILCAVLAVLQIGLGITAFIAESKYIVYINLMSTFVYGAFYFLSIRVHIGKVLFMLFLLSVATNLCVVFGKFLHWQLFPHLATENYTWSHILCYAFSECLFLPLVYLFLKKWFRPILCSSQFKIWSILWLVPLVFYVVWCYTLNNSAIRSASVAVSRPETLLFLCFLNFGAMVCYVILGLMLKEHEEFLSLQSENYSLSMQNLQYRHLRDRIDETRKQSHDLRQHATVMAAYAEKGQYPALREYLSQYLKTIPEPNALVYCQNFAVNSVISYYAEIASAQEIIFDCAFLLPEESPIQETDLVVIMGNLLENAIEGNQQIEKGARRMRLRGGMQNPLQFAFTLDNPCKKDIQRNEFGHILSGKHSGEGIGTASTASIVERYNGVFRLETKNGMFCASVLIPIEQQAE